MTMSDTRTSVEPHDEAQLKDLLRWAYSKLHDRQFSKQEDCLKLDAIKFILEHDL